jgi:hypothetical protein
MLKVVIVARGATRTSALIEFSRDGVDNALYL